MSHIPYTPKNITFVKNLPTAMKIELFKLLFNTTDRSDLTLTNKVDLPCDNIGLSFGYSTPEGNEHADVTFTRSKNITFLSAEIYTVNKEQKTLETRITLFPVTINYMHGNYVIIPVNALQFAEAAQNGSKLYSFIKVLNDTLKAAYADYNITPSDHNLGCMLFSTLNKYISVEDKVNQVEEKSKRKLKYTEEMIHQLTSYRYSVHVDDNTFYDVWLELAYENGILVLLVTTELNNIGLGDWGRHYYDIERLTLTPYVTNNPKLEARILTPLAKMFSKAKLSRENEAERLADFIHFINRVKTNRDLFNA